MQPTNLVKITGLYKQTSKAGDVYLQGSFTLGAFSGYIKLFPVKDKKNEKGPDYTITVDYKENALGLLRLGGLWRQTDKKGETFLTGRFNNFYVKVLKNTFKEKETEPDYNIFFSQFENSDRVQKTEEV